MYAMLVTDGLDFLSSCNGYYSAPAWTSMKRTAQPKRISRQASSGSYATLERQTQTSPIDGGTLIFYRLPGGALAGEPPAGLTLDIEGTSS